MAPSGAAAPEPKAGGKNDSDGMVGLGRLELPTSRLSSARSNQLSYKPAPRVQKAMSRIKGQRLARPPRREALRTCSRRAHDKAHPPKQAMRSSGQRS